MRLLKSKKVMFYIIKSQKIPHSYFEQSKEKGKIINFSYLVKKENENLVGKIAQIYLPFGYQETKPYNILYYLHGFGGTHEDLLSKYNGRMKNILDQMIQNKICSPLIVVSASWNNSQEKEDWQTSCLEVNTFYDEFRFCLIPSVENRFSTYAKSIDANGIINCRNHRALAAFSLGCIASQRIFEKCNNIQKWYLNACGHYSTSQDLNNFIKYIEDNKPYSGNKCTDSNWDQSHCICFASGERDPRHNKISNIINNLKEGYLGNNNKDLIWLPISKGYHGYNTVFESFYNFLPLFSR